MSNTSHESGLVAKVVAKRQVFMQQQHILSSIELKPLNELGSLFFCVSRLDWRLSIVFTTTSHLTGLGISISNLSTCGYLPKNYTLEFEKKEKLTYRCCIEVRDYVYITFTRSREHYRHTWLRFWVVEAACLTLVSRREVVLVKDIESVDNAVDCGLCLERQLLWSTKFPECHCGK